MPDTAPTNPTAPGSTGTHPPAPVHTQAQQTGGQTQPASGAATGSQPAPPAPKSFGQMMEKAVVDSGQEFGLDDNGRMTLQPLSKPETIEGHSVEDLERIANGGQPVGKPDGQGDDDEQRQQQGRQAASSAPAAPVQPAAPSAPDPRDARIDKLTELVNLLLEEKKGSGSAAPAAAAAPAPASTPAASAASAREAMRSKLEAAGLDTELADILVEFGADREREIRDQIARDYNLPTLSLQSDLVRLYNQYGEDFKAHLPAIELIRSQDPSIPLEAAYKGAKAIAQAMGHTAPAPGAQNGAPSNSEPPAQPRVLTQEEARALLAKRDLMRTTSGVNGTEARPSTQNKQSFGERLHQNLTTARRQGRAGG